MLRRQNSEMGLPLGCEIQVAIATDAGGPKSKLHPSVFHRLSCADRKAIHNYTGFRKGVNDS